MSLKSKLRLLYEEIAAEYERVQNANSRRATERISNCPDFGDIAMVDSIIGIFRKYLEYVNEELKERKSNDDYEQLEKSLQVQEAEIRNHIRLEQQMKLYTESLQSKLEQTQRVYASQNYANTKTIQLLKKQIEKHQEQQILLSNKETGSMVNTHTQVMRYSSKQKCYGSIRYDTENRKTPVKESKKQGKTHTSTSFLSKVSIPYQDITNSIHHVRTQGDQKNHRSTSKEQGLCKGMKGSSIHVLTNKTNFGSYRK